MTVETDSSTIGFPHTTAEMLSIGFIKPMDRQTNWECSDRLSAHTWHLRHFVYVHKINTSVSPDKKYIRCRLLTIPCTEQMRKTTAGFFLVPVPIVSEKVICYVFTVNTISIIDNLAWLVDCATPHASAAV